MLYVYASILVLMNLVWLVVTALGLPGNWLMIGGAVALTWWQWKPGAPWGEQMFHPATLIAVVVLALIGELIEFLAGALGSRQAGGSVWGSLAATVGGIAGAIVGTIVFGAVAVPPPISTILGAVIGAFGGSAIVELMIGRKRDHAFKVGQGAALGHITGVISKFLLGCAIWLIIAVAAFWP